MFRVFFYRVICQTRCRRILFAQLALGLTTLAFAAEKDAIPGRKPVPPAGQTSRPLPQKPSGNKSGEAAIRATAAAFVKAFNEGNAKTVASLWTASGSLTDENGRHFKGRPVIEAQYAQFFKEHPGARLEVAVTSIDFAAPTMAIEDGVTRLLTRDNVPPSASRYTAVHIQEDGKWRMVSVSEAALDVQSNFSRLQDLGWLIGEWETKADGNTIRSQFRWIANKSFIQRNFSVRYGGLVTTSGTQIIGWDPLAEQVRSWTFDSSGGFGAGLWSAAPEGIRIESTGVMPDGALTSSKDLLIRVPGADNILGWRSFDRKMGETKLPDTREVVLDRVISKP